MKEWTKRWRIKESPVRVKAGLVVALLAAVTGCVGYVGDGDVGVDVGGPVVVGGVWDGGFVGRDVAHGWARRGAFSRGVAHGGGFHGGGCRR